MRYRDLRLPSDAPVEVEDGTRVHRTELIDVSVSGARLARLDGMTRDRPLTLRYLGVRILARVIWSNERQTGVRFVAPLTASEMTALRREASRRPGDAASPGLHGFRELT